MFNPGAGSPFAGPGQGPRLPAVPGMPAAPQVPSVPGFGGMGGPGQGIRPGLQQGLLSGLMGATGAPSPPANQANSPISPKTSQAPAAPPVASGGAGGQAVSLAQRQLGDPYKWGGTTPAGFDCSGLVQYVYGQAGKTIPRTSQEQWAATAGSRISSVAALQPGDLVFFDNTDGPGQATHVGIYIGGGRMINAPDAGKPVQVADLTSGFWAQHFAGGGRVA